MVELTIAALLCVVVFAAWGYYMYLTAWREPDPKKRRDARQFFFALLAAFVATEYFDLDNELARFAVAAGVFGACMLVFHCLKPERTGQ